MLLSYTCWRVAVLASFSAHTSAIVCLGVWERRSNRPNFRATPKEKEIQKHADGRRETEQEDGQDAGYEARGGTPQGREPVGQDGDAERVGEPMGSTEVRQGVHEEVHEMKLEFRNFRKYTLHGTHGLYLFDDMTYKGQSYGRELLQSQKENEDDERISSAVIRLWKGRPPMPPEDEEEEFMNVVEFHVNQAYIEYLESLI